MLTAYGYNERKGCAIPNNYRSKFEARVASYLESRNITYEYEKWKLPYTVPETVKNYIPDWKIGDTYIETKGLFTSADRKKMLLVREANPGVVLRLLFMNADVKLRKGSPTSYGTWATKNNFEWWDFRKGIPKHWLEGKR